MLYGYFISNTSNGKMGPLFYFTLSAESLYNRLQSLLIKLPTDEKGGQTYPIFCYFYIYKSGPKAELVVGRNPLTSQEGCLLSTETI